MVFPVTHLSILERVQSGDADLRRAAFGDLAEGYWRPSYHYLRLHWRLPADEAEDIVQAFFTTAFEKRYLERYDPARAKFRTFLRTCLDRFVQNRRKAARAGRRGGAATVLSLDFPGAERDLAALASRTVTDVERFFHDETVRALLARTVDTLRRACEAEGKRAMFQVFERHDLAPTAETTYATVARDLDLTMAQVTNYLHVARRRFRDTALAELRSLVGTDDEFRTEARELFGVDVDA
ncbi:MAG TPA: hypothetical protein VMM93_14295 [Vicinamibacterales bacterium]|nr:hypothetical protein [Vicinamibacterales bacterium]